MKILKIPILYCIITMLFFAISISTLGNFANGIVFSSSQNRCAILERVPIRNLKNDACNELYEVKIWLSLDYGIHWKKIEIPQKIKNQLIGTRDFIMLPDGNIFILIGNGDLYVSNNNFQDWEKIHIDENIRDYFRIWQVQQDSLLCLVGSKDWWGYLLISKDKGKSWSLVDSAELNKDAGYVGYSYDNNKIIRILHNSIDISNDLGENWKPITAIYDPLGISLDAIAVYNKTILLVESEGGEFGDPPIIVYSTTNSGKTWASKQLTSEKDNLHSPKNIQALDYPVVEDSVLLNDKEGLILLSDRILRTADGGKTWKIILKTKFLGERFYITDNGDIWIAGVNIFKSTDKGKTWKLIKLHKK